jgi:hypothetical protein
MAKQMERKGIFHFLDIVTPVTYFMFTMNDKWILFSYSVPATNPKARMRIWRRISASGAVQLKTGLQVLPNREDLLENITWLIGQVQSLGGEALAIQCARVEGMPDEQIEKLFQAQIDPEFAQIQAEARAVMEASGHEQNDDRGNEYLLAMRKLRKRYESLQSRDFFPSGASSKARAMLDAAEEKVRTINSRSTPVSSYDRTAYQGRIWVTRAHPYIDRLSSFWLIRRFVDANATIRFLQAGETPDLESGEVPFDMVGAEFSHQGELITFEVMARGFALFDGPVVKIGHLVRFIDIQEGPTLPDDAGLLKTLIDGLVAITSDDHHLMEQALVLFDALHAGYANTLKGTF